jgi:anti-sigma regulatory factor (Ser/Thr protein kinase)
MSAADETLHLDLDRDLSNVSRARRWLTDQLRAKPELSRDQVDEAGVVISELVTNVFRHTSSDARITVSSGDQAVRVEVHDDDASGVPVLRPIDPLRTGGNGIRILEAFSSDWGCDRHPAAGKEVWFTLSW